VDSAAGLTLRELALDEAALARLERGDATALPDDRPDLADAVAAIEQPDLRLRLTVDGRECPGWIADGSAALTEPNDDGSFGLVALASGGVAARIARIVGLDARPRRPQPELVELEAKRLERTLAARRELSADEARAELDLPVEAPDDLAAAIGGVAASVRRRWRLEATTSDGELVGLVEVLDAGDQGYWQLIPAPGRGRVHLASSSTALIWQQLGALPSQG
jgi:hypothetical protein